MQSNGPLRASLLACCRTWTLLSIEWHESCYSPNQGDLRQQGRCRAHPQHWELTCQPEQRRNPQEHCASRKAQIRCLWIPRPEPWEELFAGVGWLHCCQGVAWRNCCCRSRYKSFLSTQHTFVEECVGSYSRWPVRVLSLLCSLWLISNSFASRCLEMYELGIPLSKELVVWHSYRTRRQSTNQHLLSMASIE